MNEMFSLKGMNAIITGGGKGLGKGIARGFLEQDANVVITGSSDAIFETEQEFREQGFQTIHAIHMDVLDAAHGRKRLRNVFVILVESWMFW